MNMFSGLKSQRDQYLPSSVQRGIFGQPCMCIGPRVGEPVCPCQMRDVKIVDGRYIRIVDLGPVPIDVKPVPLSDVLRKAVGL